MIVFSVCICVCVCVTIQSREKAKAEATEAGDLIQGLSVSVRASGSLLQVDTPRHCDRIKSNLVWRI